MSLPISIPYTFASQSGSVPVSQVDTNFATVAAGVNGIGNGTNSLSNVSITGGSISNVSLSGLTTIIPVSSGGTGLATLTANAVVVGNATGNVTFVSPGAASNVLASDGTNWISTANPANAGAIPAAYSGLKIQTTTSANIAVTANYVSLYSGAGFYTAPSVNLTIQTSVSGANGLDTGTIANNTWYSVWVIYNDTTVAGLLSTSATTPTLPSGYTYKARVGWVRYGTGALYSTIQYGNRTQYILPSGGQIAMASGTASQWTAIAVGSYVPSTASIIYFLALGQTQNATLGVSPNATSTSVNLGSFAYVVSPNSAAYAGVPGSILLESTNIYWYSTGASNQVFVQGWEDNL